MIPRMIASTRTSRTLVVFYPLSVSRVAAARSSLNPTLKVASPCSFGFSFDVTQIAELFPVMLLLTAAMVSPREAQRPLLP